MTIIVRRATKQDIPEIMELLKQVNKVHYDGRPDLFKLATKYTEDELEAILNDDNTPVFVADKDGKVLGHGFCVFQRPANTKLLTDIVTLYIDDICVDETARGKRVGTEIFNHVKDFAKKNGCYDITLNVWEGNDAAKAFYEAMGLKVLKYGMEIVL